MSLLLPVVLPINEDEQKQATASLEVSSSPLLPCWKEHLVAVAKHYEGKHITAAQRAFLQDKSQYRLLRYEWDGNGRATYASTFADVRLSRVCQMMDKAYHWMRNHAPDVWCQPSCLYFWVSDRVPWEAPADFPFFVQAAPSDTPYFLFPETTFENFTIHGRGDCDWDQAKIAMQQQMQQSQQPSLLQNKEEVVYFRGAETGNSRNGLRRFLFAQKFPDAIRILPTTSSWNRVPDKEAISMASASSAAISNTFESPSEWSRYRYLLNLAGNLEWSNREKFLFLSRSAVVHVDTTILNDDYGAGCKDTPYRTFLDFFVRPGRDYINVPLELHRLRHDRQYRDITPPLLLAENKRRMEHLVQQLHELVRSDPAKYQQMAEQGYQTVSAITNNTINAYLTDLIRTYNSLPFFK